MTHNVQFPKLGISFTLNETAFSIGDFEIKWYGIIIAVGFILALIYAVPIAKKMNIDMNYLFDSVIVGLIAGIIFARLFYVAFYPGDLYWNNPMEIFNIHSGGLAIYGGIIGALVFGGITAKIRKLNVLAVLDIASLGFLIGQSVGRWGNFINQEAFGTATDLPWGMYSDNTALIVDGNVHPCFLYESLLCLAGFIFLHFFNLKLRRYDGQTFILYVAWYGFIRFFIEGIRTDSLMIPYVNLRVSQVIAGVSVIVSVILLIALRRRTKLTGCGNKKIMEALNLNAPAIVVEETVSEKKTSDIPQIDETDVSDTDEESKTVEAPAEGDGNGAADNNEKESEAPADNNTKNDT